MPAHDEAINHYLGLKVRFSEAGELYQSVDGAVVKATRDLHQRWVEYGLTDADVRGKSVLDIGCNIGGFAAICSAAGCRSYHGTDVDAASIALARQLYGALPGCTFEVIPFAQMTATTRYDVVLALAVWRYTRLTYEEYLRRLRLIAQPRGLVLFESHTHEAFDPYRELFTRYFAVEDVRTVPAVTGRDIGTRYFARLRSLLQE